MLEVKKFYGLWCGPCRVLTPIINEIKEQFPNVNFYDVDIDEEFEEATKYNIRSVPTVIVIKDGVEVNRVIGLSTKSKYTGILNEQFDK
jgi:thioredoxin 1